MFSPNLPKKKSQRNNMTDDWREVLSKEEKDLRRLIKVLPGNEKVFRQGRSLIVALPDSKRMVLSSASFNGGVFEGPTAIFNTTGIGGPAEMKLMTGGRAEHLLYSVECAKNVDIDPKTSVGFGTAVHMDNAVIVTKAVGETTVSAIVTGGVEGNGGRVGDPSSYDESKKYQKNKGTIVIMLFIEANLSVATMARAIMTATEAKTCALQQLMASSVYSTGIASGSGTDQIGIICDRGSSLELSDAGKHSLLGELIGKCVLEGVTKALDKHGNLNPNTQMSLVRRLERYKVKPESYFDSIKKMSSEVDMASFNETLKYMSVDPSLVSIVCSVIHIQDEIGWGLVPLEEGTEIGNKIIRNLLLKNLPEDHLESIGFDFKNNLISNLVLSSSILVLEHCDKKYKHHM